MKDSVLAPMLIDLMMFVTKSEPDRLDEDLGSAILEMTSVYIDMMSVDEKKSLAAECRKVASEYDIEDRDDIEMMARDLENIDDDDDEE